MPTRGSHGSNKVRVSTNRSINPARVRLVRVRPGSEFGDKKSRIELVLDNPHRGPKIILEPWLSRGDVIAILKKEAKYSELKERTNRRGSGQQQMRS